MSILSFSVIITHTVTIYQLTWMPPPVIIDWKLTRCSSSLLPSSDIRLSSCFCHHFPAFFISITNEGSPPSSCFNIFLPEIIETTLEWSSEMTISDTPPLILRCHMPLLPCHAEMSWEYLTEFSPFIFSFWLLLFTPTLPISSSWATYMSSLIYIITTHYADTLFAACRDIFFSFSRYAAADTLFAIHTRHYWAADAGARAYFLAAIRRYAFAL